jgi:hypothetical protein
VATLPDLTQMQVITYINEVDIQKVKVGQYVEIGLDAEPGKKLEGGVVQVANVGEQKPNSDAKVFEVLIDVLTQDPSLRPAMTTSCKIHAGLYTNVLSVPLEALNNMNGLSFVYKKQGTSLVRQQVLVGAVNENQGVIYGGLNKDDVILLSTPTDTSGLELKKLVQKPSAPSQSENATWKKRWADFQSLHQAPKSEFHPATPGGK